MGIVIPFPPVCINCHAKRTIENKLTGDPHGQIIAIDFCTACGTIQSEPSRVTESV